MRNPHQVIPAKAGISVSPRTVSSADRDSRFRGNVSARARRPRIAAGLLAILFTLIVFPALAAETITSFTSNIVMRIDGSVEVTENIVVNVEHENIRRGITRDIFTVLINDDKSRLRSDLEVLEVLRGGRAEPFTLEAAGTNATRIKIGDAGVILPLGPQRYTIRYTMTRQGRFFADHDELFWNATGHYSIFPTERAVATVQLPDGATIEDLEAYTGRVGSTEQAVTITRTSDNTATFTANRALAAYEGMTIAVAFNKGLLTRPEGWDALVLWLSDHRDVVLPLIAVLIVLAYNLWAWTAVGRDPAKGTIIPLFHPPKGFSPALVQYVNKYGWTNNGWTAFTATLFDLGVKGLLKISNAGKLLKVTVTGNAPKEPLPAGEKLLFDYFTSKGNVIVNTTNGPDLNTKRGEFLDSIQNENRQAYFSHNAWYVVIGVLLSIALLYILISMEVLEPVYVIVAIIGGVAVGMFSGLLFKFWSGNLIFKIVLGLWVVIGGSNLIGFGSAFLGGLRLETGLIAAVSIVVINVVFGILMRAPTVQGRKLMDQIDGFKLYLETAEKGRLNLQSEPPMSVDRFERILPYAIALGVEKPWSEHFEGELARNAVQGADGAYQPSFYSGRNWSNGGSGGGSSGISNAVSAATAGMSAAMIAAQPVSSSSSGFSSSGGGGGGGGGGSSGGGGGGGGVGGW